MYFFNTTGGSGSGAGAGTGSAGLGGATASGVSFFLPVYFLKIFIKNQIVHVRFFFCYNRLAFPVPRMVDLELAVEADPLDRISLLARISQLVMEAAKASANKFPYIPDLISEILVDDEYLYCIL
jgi:hypothetical protein